LEAGAVSGATVDTFTAEWEAWREQRDRQLTEPRAILAITSINFLTEEPVAIDGIPGRWSTSADGPVVELADGDELFDDDRRLTGRVPLGPLAGNPPRWFQSGRIAVQAMHVAGWDLIRPHDPESPLRTGYAGTPAYAPDPRWLIEGRWLPYEAPRRTELGSVQTLLGGAVDAPGEVEFELDGRLHRLVATPAWGTPGHVALLFRDRTSGVTTYPAQRELLVRLPESGDEVELDFNRAYNKNCAYTDFAICPLPPAENELDVAVEAGEQIPYERPTLGAGTSIPS
jgi:uncharacterized protein (DUF1684 family)